MFPYEWIASIVSVCALCVSIYSVRQSKRSELNAAYFAQMTAAYSDYLGSISKFVLDGGLEARDDLTVRLCQLKLFATPAIKNQAVEIYRLLLDWRSKTSAERFPFDNVVDELSKSMREHLDSFRYHTETEMWSDHK